VGSFRLINPMKAAGSVRVVVAKGAGGDGFDWCTLPDAC
jgi:hypothetical protein